MNTRWNILASAGLAALVGCGGGGGGSDAPAPQSGANGQYVVAATMLNVLTAGATFTATTQISGATWTLTQSFAAQPAQGFDGAARSVSTENINLSRNGVLQSADGAYLYFDAAPLVLRGSSRGGDTAVFSQDGVLPQRADVGASGPLYHYTAQPSGTTNTVTWSMQPGAASTALFCLNATIRTNGTGAAATESDCYRVDASGNLIGAQFTVTINGQTFTFS